MPLKTPPDLESASMNDYLTHWGLTQAVFHRALAYGRMYHAPQRQKDLQRLTSLAQQAKTLQLVSAPAGHGKSTLAQWLYSRLDPMRYEGFLSLVLPQKAPHDFSVLPALNDFLIGRSAEAMNPWRATAKGYEQLLEENRQLVLIVELAQGCEPRTVMTELGGLVELSTKSRAALAVIILGDETLGTQLAQAPNLAERLAFHWRLAPFTREESEHYVRWYVQEAGMANCPFAEGAFHALHLHTQGIAAKINSLGENCLMEAAFRGQKTIDAPLVEAMVALSMTGAAQSQYNEGTLANRDIGRRGLFRE